MTGRTALVAGAGFAGLLAADALRRAGWTVTLLERNDLPEAPAPRDDLPQTGFTHVLLAGGWQRLSARFPGLEARLVAHGSEALDLARDCAVHHQGSWVPRFESTLRTHACSRGLLEWAVRREVLSGGAQIEQGVELLGLGPLDARGRAGAFRVRGDGGREELRRADLLVDATGRRSRLRQWIEEAGGQAPRLERLKTETGYACRQVRPPTETTRDWRYLYLFPAGPELPRGGVIYPIEGDRWMVSLIAANGERVPSTDEEFDAFASRLPSPELAEALRGAERLGPLRRFLSMENRRLHPDGSWPGDLLALGDASCAVNPVYGQGMSLAAVSADLLESELRRGPRFSAPVFQKKLFQALDPLWRMVALEDLRWPSTLGERGFGHELLTRYVDQLHRASHQDLALYRVLAGVIQMTRPASDLLRPGCIARVGWAAMRP